MAKIKIDRFDGGKNDWDHQLIINENECASATMNVWAPQGALTKSPGWTEITDVTGTGTRMLWLYADSGTVSSYDIYARISTATSTARIYPWASPETSPAWTPLGHTTGSVSISGATLISATGSGTSWATQASALDMFRVDSSAASWYQVSSVEDNTHLTLTSAVPVAVATGSAYTILPGLTVSGGIAQLGHPHASLAGYICSVNIDTIMQVYDTTGMIRVPAAPKAYCLEQHKGYMFAGRTLTAGSRLYWSAIRNPLSWPANNFIDIDKGNGFLSGIKSYGNELVVFKTNGIHRVLGETFDPANPTYSVSPIKTPDGFQFNSPFSSAIYKGLLVFYARGALWSYRIGQQFIEKISTKYTPNLLANYNLISSVGGSDVLKFGVSFQDKYLLSNIDLPATVGTLSSVGMLGMLDEKGAWWVFAVSTADDTGGSGPFGSSVPMIVVGPSATSKPRVIGAQIATTTGDRSRLVALDYIGATSFGTAYTIRNTGATTAIRSTWVSKEFNIGFGAFTSIVIYLEKQVAGNLTFDWSIDQAAFVSNTIDMTIGRGNMIRKTLDINQRGSTIQLRIIQNTVSQTFRVFGIEINYEPDPEDRLP